MITLLSFSISDEEYKCSTVTAPSVYALIDPFFASKFDITSSITSHHIIIPKGNE